MLHRTHIVRPSLGSALVGLLVFVAFLWLTFRLAAVAFKLLWYAGPVLLVAAFFIDRDTVLGFFRWLGGAFRQNPLVGLLYAVLAVVAYPLVCGWLFAKALLKRTIRRKVGDLQERMQAHARQAGDGHPGLGDEDGDYQTVRRDDGLVIRIPREGE